MDIQYFLEERTTFIRFYYDQAAAGFLEIHRKIGAKEAPYDHPSHDESGEPPYLEEYSAAADGLVVLGRSAISMLKQAMQDYFDEWVKRLALKSRGDWSNGMFPGFRKLFESEFGICWADSGSDLELLEQVVLARNAEQHGTDITSVQATHPEKDTKRFGEKLRFVSEFERKWRERKEADEDHLPFFGSQVEVNRDDLWQATEEFERLVTWLDPQLNTIYYGHESGPFPVKDA